ncbi:MULTISPECIES: hypothetical protein [Streptomyces]|uniref:hypothetical protein n=1 Tax=Streptomyces TaxID=1883 RepID=UPI00167328F8|nr:MULTISPECIES: hypothetical protein [Streptomyces]MBD3575076.1 hypothetical protein [Streptomyces sp. KD18]GGT16928.1 hypothetical protein GCM10010286_48200 [Streptomyces toxytricini]
MMDDHTGPRGGEEQELRTLLHAAVAGLEPSDGALERLRHAVPARRTRRRRALVGAAAAVLLAGAGVPTAVHLSTTAGSGAAGHSAMAGHGHDHTVAGAGGTGTRHDGGHESNTAPDGGSTTGHGTADPDPSGAGSPDGGSTTGPEASGGPAVPGSGPMPPVTAQGAPPGCSADQLGVRGSAQAPEPDGKVYGSFKVTNVSARGCTVTGPDTVTAASVSASAAGKGVAVVGHKAGDPAAKLPDPAAEAPQLVLQPNTAYEVRFAWVPSGESCAAAPSGAGSAPPAGGTPQDEQRTDAGGGTTGSADQGTTPAPETAAVEVTHTPAAAGAAAPTTQTTIPAACGGTVYRTGVIPLDEPKQ